MNDIKCFHSKYATQRPKKIELSIKSFQWNSEGIIHCTTSATLYAFHVFRVKIGLDMFSSSPLWSTLWMKLQYLIKCRLRYTSWSWGRYKLVLFLRKPAWLILLVSISFWICTFVWRVRSFLTFFHVTSRARIGYR